MTRRASSGRDTKETSVEVDVVIDGSGEASIATGIPFFDHMLEQLAKHGGMGLVVKAKGDLEVDTHHTVEDTGIVLGTCFREALGDKAGVRRFANTLIPLDEALVEVAVDLSGRPFLAWGIEFAPDTPPLGEPGFVPQLTEEFWRAFVVASGVTLHVVLREGKNTHHIIEATFKAIARALRDAVRIDGSAVPSTKGTL